MTARRQALRLAAKLKKRKESCPAAPGGAVAAYRICVKGSLDESWSDRMAGLHISTEFTPEGPLTTLEGEVRDQAQLTGVLDALTDMNLTLVSVQSLANGTKP
jgi:hypothetical protein